MQNNAKEWRRMRMYKHTSVCVCSNIFSAESKSERAWLICSRRVNGAKGPWRARGSNAHPGGTFAIIYQKYSAKQVASLLQVYCVKMWNVYVHVCVFAHRRQPREEAPQGEITTRSRSFARLLIASAQPPVGVKCTYTLAHTTPLPVPPPHSSAALLFR